MLKKNLKTCKNGHQFYKSSDCPVCPLCESERKPSTGFLSQISAPARRALEGIGITSLNKLSEYKEEEIKALHGVGPHVIHKLQAALKSQNLPFKK